MATKGQKGKKHKLLSIRNYQGPNQKGNGRPASRSRSRSPSSGNPGSNKPKRQQKRPDEWEGLTDRDALTRLAHELLEKHKLLAEYNEGVKHQVADIASGKVSLTPEQEALYKDLRHLYWASIDNDDTRDIDQLTAAEQLADGRVRILIAVADCDYLVPKDSPIDVHALHNTSSLYTPAKVFPMLPTELSYGITSLNPGEDRRAYVMDVVMASADNAEIVEENLYLAIVHNKAKLAYPSMSEWFKGGEMPPALAAAKDSEKLAETLKLQDQVARAILEKRRTNGALEFESMHPDVVWDNDTVADLVCETQNRAQKLIENFMLTANGVTSRFLRARGSPTIQRVVKEPEKWEEIRFFAKNYGFELPTKVDNLALRRFLSQRREADLESFPDLCLTVIKLMGRGEYIFTSADEEGLGHFGLAVVDYTHSTAPNRRYPDLVTQRMLRAILSGAPAPYPEEELNSVAERCSDIQSSIAKIERHIAKASAALLLHDRIGEIFDGIITGIKEGNTWVRLLSVPVEGNLVKSSGNFKVGTKLRVELVSANAHKGFVDFRVVKESKATKQQKQ